MGTDSRSTAIFTKRVLIAIALAVFVLLLLALLYYTFDVILLVFAAALIAILLRGLADLLGRFVKIGEGWLILTISVAAIALIAAAVAGLAPSIAEQMAHLRDELPRSVEAGRVYLTRFGWSRTIIEQLPDPAAIWDNITSSGFLVRVGGIFSSTIGAVGNFLIVILLALYFAIEPKFYATGFAKLFPIKKRERVLEVLAAIAETLQWWLIGKAASMLFIGVLTWIALSILGVPLALTLGLIAGLMSFIPNFGPILSALPAVLIAFIESPIMAVYVIGIYIGVQLIESNVVTPLIERETVQLPPGLTVIFQLGLAVLVGGLGLILATPLLAMIVVLIQMVYIQDVLGDTAVEVEETIGDREIKAAGADLRRSE